MLRYCEKEVDHIIKLFRREKDNPPLPRHYPAISGRIKWTRALHAHVEDLVNSVSSHPILKSLPVASELIRKYNNISAVFKGYEEDLKSVWACQEVLIIIIIMSPWEIIVLMSQC